MSVSHPLPPPSLNTSTSTASLTAFADFPSTPDYDDVESPSLTSGNALARFEFEKPGSRDSRDGTKVLMVEWEDDDTTSKIRGTWTVSWEGKRAAVLSAKDGDGAKGHTEGAHRLYFLLPAEERVPGTVILTLEPGLASKDREGDKERVVWRTHPLPAIFPPELGACARAAGKKGVLHTVWAKKRLQVLKQEIEAEEQQHAEGIALQMAVQERDWIELNFGVKTRPASIAIPARSPNTDPNPSLAPELGSPISPKSPGRGPLLEKLKGLKLGLGTSEKDLGGADARQASREQNPLSPEGSDVAVSSFGSFAALNGFGDTAASLAAKPAQQPARTMVPQRPPENVLAQQQWQQRPQVGMGSLNAFASHSAAPVEFRTGNPPSAPASSTTTTTTTTTTATPPGAGFEDEDGLFALPLSPRSPDQVGRGRFTFAQEDTVRYLKGES
ncbi:hypothetical protein MBLNU459_g5793t1 [Dothideomycetes sp. NU459]